MNEPTNDNQELSDKPIKSVDNRRPDGTFGPGNIGNPNGRPVGKTMKEFAREYLMNLEDKQGWLDSLSKDTIWKMAEGNPHQTTDTDLTTGGKPLRLLANINDVPDNNSDSEDSEVKEED